jgi:hypothetical protein
MLNYTLFFYDTFSITPLRKQRHKDMMMKPVNAMQAQYQQQLNTMKSRAADLHILADKQDNGFLGKASNKLGNTLRRDGSVNNYESAYAALKKEIAIAESELRALNGSPKAGANTQLQSQFETVQSSFEEFNTLHATRMGWLNGSTTAMKTGIGIGAGTTVAATGGLAGLAAVALPVLVGASVGMGVSGAEEYVKHQANKTYRPSEEQVRKDTIASGLNALQLPIKEAVPAGKVISDAIEDGVKGGIHQTVTDAQDPSLIPTQRVKNTGKAVIREAVVGSVLGGAGKQVEQAETSLRNTVTVTRSGSGQEEAPPKKAPVVKIKPTVKKEFATKNTEKPADEKSVRVTKAPESKQANHFKDDTSNASSNSRG